MKILYLTKYTRMAGSSRMRSYQYFPYLEKAGMTVVVKPFFDDDYLKDFYAGKKNIGTVVKSYLRRFFVLFSVLRYNNVVIEKEIFPFLPAFAEWMLKSFGIKYIVDYDDAIFHNYDKSSNPVIRKFLGNKIARVMRYSGTVVAGNNYLAEYARKAGAKNIEIIPTVIDINRYPSKNNHSDLALPPNVILSGVEGKAGERSASENNQKFVVGWIGTKTTFEKHLLPCKDWIKALQIQDPNIRFHIVGITEDMDLGKNVQYIRWTEDTEVAEILKMDIGLMPLQDSKWEKGKCAYKLIQYAACGIPGVASDVGMNKEVCIDGETGFIATSNEEWKERILFFKNEIEERLRMGTNARKLVEQKYCIQVTSEKWIKILKE
ncbi:glycosyltransferase family 4 protein [Epilithonimonas hominis]|uniref:Glycosyltransferase n=1 Tax=Epilithonimonas hominis TaxID=420404 RepID=A0A3N0X6C3_9FLAO|nr:glycosyltransferase family 4 protein [Epilithonimonas hominis]ROI12944.1 glycosyltransferase [Epilithonimonas hominis]